MRGGGAGMSLNDSVYDRLLRERIIFRLAEEDDALAQEAIVDGVVQAHTGATAAHLRLQVEAHWTDLPSLGLPRVLAPTLTKGADRRVPRMARFRSGHETVVRQAVGSYSASSSAWS